MYLWLCGITFFLFVAFGWLLKCETGIRYGRRSHKPNRMEEGE